MNNTDGSNKKVTLSMWFRSLRRTSRIAVVVGLIAPIAVVAYATSILFDHAHQSITVDKDNFVKVELQGVTATGKVKPGDSISAAPVLKNGSSINCVGFLVVTVPMLGGESAYDYEVGSGWHLLEEDTAAGEFVYAYGDSSELTVIAPGDSTDALTNGFTMKSSISGTQFNSLSSVDIEFDGYLLDSNEESDPGRGWEKIPKQ